MFLHVIQVNHSYGVAAISDELRDSPQVHMDSGRKATVLARGSLHITQSTLATTQQFDLV